MLSAMRGLAFGTCLATAACTAIPDLPDDHSVSLKVAVDRVQCELQDVLREYADRRDERGRKPYGWLRDWVMKGTFTLTRERSTVFNPLATLTNAPGVFSLVGAAGKTTDYANRLATFELWVYLFQAEEKICDVGTRDGRYFAGETGARQWLKRVLDAMDSDDVVHEPHALSHKLDFRVTFEPGATPTWTFAAGTASSGLSGAYYDRYQLDMTFAEPEAADLKAARLQYAAWKRGANSSIRSKVGPGTARKFYFIETQNLKTIQVSPSGAIIRLQ